MKGVEMSVSSLILSVGSSLSNCEHLPCIPYVYTHNLISAFIFS